MISGHLFLFTLEGVISSCQDGLFYKLARVTTSEDRPFLVKGHTLPTKGHSWDMPRYGILSEL